MHKYKFSPRFTKYNLIQKQKLEFLRQQQYFKKQQYIKYIKKKKNKKEQEIKKKEIKEQEIKEQEIIEQQLELKEQCNIILLQKYIKNFLYSKKKTFKIKKKLDKKIIAVIPIFGRDILLKYTIQRLYNKNNIYKVICIGSNKENKNTAISNNAEWLYHKNKPLGKKWNYGFQYAKKYNPDGILFVGSSDWICDEWLINGCKYLDDYGIIGKPNYYMYNITNNKQDICHWLGYSLNSGRYKETIGIGRILSKKFLKKINYKPFNNLLDSSMDYTMYNKCINKGLKILCSTKINGIFLSISCDLWNNMHKFIGHYLGAQNNIKKLFKYCKNDIHLFKIYYNTVKLTNKQSNIFFKKFPELKLFYNDYYNVKNNIKKNNYKI